MDYDNAIQQKIVFLARSYIPRQELAPVPDKTATGMLTPYAIRDQLHD